MVVAGGSFKFCRTTGGHLLAPVKKGSDTFRCPFIERKKGQTLLKRQSRDNYHNQNKHVTWRSLRLAAMMPFRCGSGRLMALKFLAAGAEEDFPGSFDGGDGERVGDWEHRP